MTSHNGSILIIRGGAIGDFILTFPVLRALRVQLPQARLEVLGYRHIIELALAGGLADAIRSIEARPLASFFAEGAELASEWQSYFEHFAIVISFLYDPEGTFRANVQRCSKAQFIVGPHRPDETEPVHATKVFLKPLQRLAIFDADPVPQLALTSVSAGSESPPPEPGNEWIALHPGSGSERKNWPVEQWTDLLQELALKPGRKLLLVGGEADQERLERLAACLPSDRFKTAFRLPLPELARHLVACSLFIGHDSGISHLAAALGRNTIVLWGDTNEVIWRPQGPRVRLIRSPNGLANLKVKEVLREVQGR